MPNMFQCMLIIILSLPMLIQSEEHWSYENIKSWSQSHKNRYCAGNVQSPIALRFNISTHDPHLGHIYIEERSSQDPIQLVNNGHTAQLNLKNHFVLKNVARENREYKVEQIHFHWGHAHDLVNGSEHSLDGRFYPLEMHMVTYSDWYGDISEALTNTRALAVVGVFFEISNESNPSLQPIVDALARIRNKGDQSSLNQYFNLKALIDEKRMRRYYRYDGSLTTPPCYESVIWSVLQKPLQLSMKQLHAFQSLHYETSKLMKNTYRTIQPIGTRKLFRNFESEDSRDGEIKEQMLTGGSHRQYSSINMKLFFALISFLMIIV